MIRPFNDVDLHAYVDGQVSPERRAAIEAYLATAPADAARVAQWRRQNETVQALFAAAAREPVPLWLTVGQIASARSTPVPLVKPTSRRTRPAPAGHKPAIRLVRPLKPALLAALAFAVGAGVAVTALRAPWLASPLPVVAAPVPLAKRALAAQALYGAETGPSIYRTDITAPEAEAWLRGRLPFALTVPSLAQQGWTFAGARLVADPAPGALLLYSDGEGDRLSLYASAAPDGADTDARAQFDGYNLLSWTRNHVAFAAITSKSPSWLVRHGAWLQDTVGAAQAASP